MFDKSCCIARLSDSLAPSFSGCSLAKLCLLREFMDINEASKMATCILAQRKLGRFLATSKRSAVHIGVLSFPEVHWCITRGINNCHDAYVALYSVHFSYEIGWYVLH